MPAPTVVPLDHLPLSDSNTGEVTVVVLRSAWVAYDIRTDDDQPTGPTVALVEIPRPWAVLIKGPNDEALHRHPYYKLGLQHYDNHEIRDSPWLDVVARARHRDGPPDGPPSGARHFVFSTKEGTVDVAGDFPIFKGLFASHDDARRHAVAQSDLAPASLPPQLLTLAALPVDRPMPLISRRRIIGEHMMVSDVLLEKGFTLASHHHENEQFVVLLTGRCIFGLGAPGTPDYHEVEVAAGQVLTLPPNLPHSCRALEDTHILDLFSPPLADHRHRPPLISTTPDDGPEALRVGAKVRIGHAPILCPTRTFAPKTPLRSGVRAWDGSLTCPPPTQQESPGQARARVLSLDTSTP